MTPAFRHMGGKARLRKWLVSHFPKQGDRYAEPFAGKGNVYFESRKSLRFREWYLGDTNPFLRSLKSVNVELLPPCVTKETYPHWRSSDDDVSRVIEPRITFAGKGYKHGFDGGDPSHPAYRGDLYRVLCLESQRLLQHATIAIKSWDQWSYERLTSRDFVYFDPPYYGTDSCYGNIDHPALIRLLNDCTFRWAISGYDSELYRDRLRWVSRREKVRNSEIKGSNLRSYTPVTEILWTNYPL